MTTGPTLALLLGAAQAAGPSPLCAALQGPAPDPRAALRALRAGADPATRCEQQVTVPVGHELTAAEFFLSVLVPPLGLALMLDKPRHTEEQTRHPTPLDLALASGHSRVVTALLEAGADPLQEAPGTEPRPLTTAVAVDVRSGTERWTRRLLVHCGMIPADLLLHEAGLADAVLTTPGVRDPLLAAGLDRTGRDASGATWLTRAARDGDPERVQAALALGAAPGGPEGLEAPVIQAARHGHSTVVTLLLEAGAPPLAGAVLAAAERGDTDTLLALIEAGGSPKVEGTFGRRPLHHALRRKDDRAIDALLAAGAEPGRGAASAFFDEPPPVTISVQAGDLSQLERLLPHLHPDALPGLLAMALRHGHADMAERLLAAGAAPGAAIVLLGGDDEASARASLRARGGRVPTDALAEVVSTGGADAVREALADGARVDTPGTPSLRLPAEVALERRAVDVLAVLVEAGARVPSGLRADPYVRDTQPEVLEAALQMGAIADAQTIREAVFWNRPEALEVLARHVHDPTQWNPRQLGLGPGLARATEIHAEKRRAAGGRRRSGGR